VKMMICDSVEVTMTGIIALRLPLLD